MSINTNLGALRAIRRLDEASSTRSQAFERLSTGFRINHASDDAAGLSVATSLHAKAQVYNQAIRNINDGVSFLNVADGATKELKNILLRLRELATQSSNGTFSNVQRTSLDKEAQALKSEYNRVVATAKFNGTSVFSGPVSVQAGAGSDAVLIIGATTGTVSTAAGDGTFQAPMSFASATSPSSVTVADFDGDGVLDLVTANYGDDSVSVLLGNGDGSFQAQRTYRVGNNLLSVTTGDFNGDGALDLVTGAPQAIGGVRILLGNGNGTFKASYGFTVGGNPNSVVVGDFNGDGILDLGTANSSDNNIGVFLGIGDGTFQAQQTYAAGNTVTSILTGDFNGDGVSDLVTVGYGNNLTNIFLGNGNGTFQASKTFVTGTNPPSANSFAVADLNDDGVLDLLTLDAGSNTTSILLGNGDGTFQARKSFTTGMNPYSVAATDVNGDGVLDLVTADAGGGTTSILFGNGDGTFQARKSVTTGANPYSVALADVNGDGVLDIVTANQGSNTTSILLGNGNAGATVHSGLTPLSGISVATRGAALAAQGRIDSYLNELNLVSGSIGVDLSRFSVASANLQSIIEVTKAAAARIIDVDVAEESARLVSTSILQQAAAAVLAHSLKDPELALKLLES